MRSWLLAFRPKTLTASLVPIMVGTSAAYAVYGKFNWLIFVLTLVSATSIQIATNLFNDAIDFKKGADDHNRIGPQRVTQSGLINEKSVWGAAIGFLALSLVTGIPLVVQGGWFILILGLMSMFLAYAYTGGPFPLAYIGLGDLFVVIFFGVVAVMGTSYLQVKNIDPLFFWLGLQVGALSTVLIAINNLRDSEGDKKVGKKTLAVIFGDDFVKGEIVFLVLYPFVLSGIFAYLDWSWKQLILFLALPIGIFILRKILTLNDKRELNPLLGKAALLHLVFGFLLSLGYLI